MTYFNKNKKALQQNAKGLEFKGCPNKTLYRTFQMILDMPNYSQKS